MLNFLLVNIFNQIEKKNSIRFNVFRYENKQAYPIYVSKERFDDHLNLLLMTNEDKQHYMLIKDFDRFMYNQTKHEHRKQSCISRLLCLSSEDILSKTRLSVLLLTVNKIQKRLRKVRKLSFKITTDSYKHHLWSMLISKQLQKKWILVNQMIMIHILKLIKNILIADSVIKSSAVMMTSIPNQLKFTEVKMRFTNPWKKW